MEGEQGRTGENGKRICRGGEIILGGRGISNCNPRG